MAVACCGTELEKCGKSRFESSEVLYKPEHKASFFFGGGGGGLGTQESRGRLLTQPLRHFPLTRQDHFASPK
jgi:hypothetical protein